MVPYALISLYCKPPPNAARCSLQPVHRAVQELQVLGKQRCPLRHVAVVNEEHLCEGGSECMWRGGERALGGGGAAMAEGLQAPSFLVF